ncbi:MAG: hypothetical protein WAO76_15130 [Georgfuchsia sp.]
MWRSKLSAAVDDLPSAIAAVGFSERSRSGTFEHTLLRKQAKRVLVIAGMDLAMTVVVDRHVPAGCHATLTARLTAMTNENPEG